MMPTLYPPPRAARAASLWLTAAWIIGAGGCATMDATECQVTDWYEKGVEDGNRGYSESRIDERVDLGQSQCHPIPGF